MNQPIPKSTVPLAGMIYDVSGSLSAGTLENMDRWVITAGITFCISEFTREQVWARLPQPPSQCLIVTPLSPPALRPRSRQAEQSGSRSPGADQLRVLCPASFTERKGQAVLLEAARKCHDRGAPVDLVFSGSGTELMKIPGTRESDWALAACRAYQSFVDAGRSVRAVGHVDDGELEVLFDEADAIVLPTLYEGFGLPVAEAVQRGLPVIASDLPPIREQLDLFDCHDRVRLVPPGNVAALADALAEFAGGRAPVRKSPGEMAHHFSRWTWGDVAGKMIKHLRQVSDTATV